MKKIFIISFVLFLSLQSKAQNKNERRIYLWDVTLSMKGYQGKTPDIYDEIVKFLEKEINSISDESTEIIVCPFQEKVLEIWKANGSEAGKRTIINKIKTYDNNKVTGTNIIGPIKFAQNNLITADKHNLLILLTDGKQTVRENITLPKFIEEWEDYANINDAFALYVMLTEESVDKEIIRTINNTDNIEVVTQPGQMEMFDFHPTNPIKVNLKDNIEKDKTVSISFNHKKGVALPSNIRIKVEANNEYFTINQEVKLKDSKISFTINYNSDYNTLKAQLAEITQIPLKISITNKDELQNAGKIVYLTKEDLTLELINKPEKVLKISIKKK